MITTDLKPKEKSGRVRRNHTMPEDLNKKVMITRGFLIMEKGRTVNIEEVMNFLIEKGFESLHIQQSA